MKGRGIRPIEALATLNLKKVLNPTISVEYVSAPFFD
jgi:hypothetical protein